ASFGQVHEAFLKSGEKVAVKIQRPKINELVNQDIRTMKFLAKAVDILPLGPNKLKPMIDQFESWTLEELNYETEANYTEEFYNRSRENSDAIMVPKIYRKFCSKKILTAEFIEGITLGNILLGIRNKNKDLLNKLSRLGFSRSKVAETLLRTSVKQIYFDGFFHADPHPANIIFMPEKKLAYIDFGIVGRLDKKSRFACLRYTRSVLYGDTATAFEALTQLCDISKLKNVENFKKEHDQIVMETFNQIKKSSLRQIVGQKLFKTMRVMQKYGAIIPPDTLRYFRAISTLDNTVLELNPEMEIGDIARKFRNISIANLIMELPSLASPEKFEDNLLRWLNLLEKEVASNGRLV
ncbi:MAG: AarF/ABC1/UbiB kinase family protein, partial [bacterium]|nr:AarF/ABC1/UbiB kinase family protein [bacterium]